MRRGSVDAMRTLARAGSSSRSSRACVRLEAVPRNAVRMKKCADRRIDILVVAHDAETGAEEDAGDLVDEADLVRAVDEQQLRRRLGLRRVGRGEGEACGITELAKLHHAPAPTRRA